MHTLPPSPPSVPPPASRLRSAASLPLLVSVLALAALPARADRDSEAPLAETPVAEVTQLARIAPAPGIHVLGLAGDHWLARSPDGWYERSSGQAEWRRARTEGVPHAAQAPATAIAGDRQWVLVGGQLPDGGAATAVTRVTLEGGTLRFEPMRDLPDARRLAAVAVLGKRLLVLGGEDASGAPTDTLLALALRGDEAWERLPGHPGGAVVAPPVAVAFDELLVFVPGAEALWGYREKPVDGTTRTGWIERKGPPANATGTVLVPSSTAHAALIGPSGAHVFNVVLDRWYRAPVAGLPEASLIASTRNASHRLAAADGTAEWNLRFSKPAYSLGWLDYAAIGLYFVAMVWVGLAFSGKGETSAQFALGNRNVKWWAAGVSMFATGASSISFLAIPALAFATNLVWFFPGIMLIVGYFITAYIIFPLLRKLEITSTYEYLDQRFNRGLRLLASAQCIIFQTFGRMSVILVLPSLAISAFTGMDVTTAVLLMGVLTTIYTAIGGFNAVIWTDVFQGVLMIAAPLLVIGYALFGAPGGAPAAIESAVAYDKMRLVVSSWDLGLPVFWVMIYGAFLNIAASVGDQPVIQRVFSVPMNQVRRTALMSSLCGIVISIFTYAMGTAIFGFYHGRPEGLSPVISNDQIVPLFIVQNLPAGICGLVIASIFAAAMSTLSSSMNSVATLVCVDFFKPLFPHASDKANLRLMKLVSYGVGIIGTAVAVYMAQQEMTSMFAVWNKIVAMLGGGFVGIYILGVFTRRANSAGAIVGGLASIAVTLWVDRSGGFHWVAYAPMAITSCLVVGYLVSVLTGGSRRNLAGLTAYTARDSRTHTA